MHEMVDSRRPKPKPKPTAKGKAKTNTSGPVKTHRASKLRGGAQNTQSQVQQRERGNNTCPISFDPVDEVHEADRYFHRWIGTTGDAQHQFYNVCDLSRYIASLKVGDPARSPLGMPLTPEDIAEVKARMKRPGVCQHQAEDMSVPIYSLRRPDGSIVILRKMTDRWNPDYYFAFWMEFGIPTFNRNYKRFNPNQLLHLSEMSMADARALLQWVLKYESFKFTRDSLIEIFVHFEIMNTLMQQSRHKESLSDQGVQNNSDIMRNANTSIQRSTAILEEAGFAHTVTDVLEGVFHITRFVKKPLETFLQLRQASQAGGSRVLRAPRILRKASPKKK